MLAPVHPAGREALLAALDEGWADPRRLHREGRQARLLLDGAREALAAQLGARTEEVVFTGSHVEAVQAAVLGTRQARRRAGDRVVLSAVEHSAVLHAADHGGAVDRSGAARPASGLIAVDRLGRVDAEQFLEQLARPGVALACLQSANGEVGTVQPVEQVAEAARTAGVPLLVDAAASIGHTEPPAGGDLLVAEPRAWGAPPGVGVLVIRAGTRWISAAPADDGIERVPGAPSVPAALAAAVTLQAVVAERAAQAAHRRALTARIRAVAAGMADTEVVGDPDHRLPHVVTFSCLYVDGEAIVDELDRAGFAVGSGSACTASTLEPSHVLAAMGVLTHGNLRIGLPTGIKAGDVAAFLEVLPAAVRRVRAQLGAGGL